MQYLCRIAITYAKVVRWSPYRLNCHWQIVILTQGEAASSRERVRNCPSLPWPSAQARSSLPKVLFPRKSSSSSHTTVHQSIWHLTLALSVSKAPGLYLCQDLVFSTLKTLFSQRLKFREDYPMSDIKGHRRILYNGPTYDIKDTTRSRHRPVEVAIVRKEQKLCIDILSKVITPLFFWRNAPLPLQPCSSGQPANHRLSWSVVCHTALPQPNSGQPIPS